MGTRVSTLLLLLVYLGSIGLSVAYAQGEKPPALEEVPTPTPTANPDQPVTQRIEVPAEVSKGEEILWLIDQRIDALWPIAIKHQESYRDMTGRYYQALWTHAYPPADAKHAYPDGWYSHPTDQQYRWNDIEILLYEELPYKARIDVYQGPEGAGWVYTYQIVLGGVLWEKSRNYGPEALRSLDWHQVIEAEE